MLMLKYNAIHHVFIPLQNNTCHLNCKSTSQWTHYYSFSQSLSNITVKHNITFTPITSQLPTCHAYS